MGLEVKNETVKYEKPTKGKIASGVIMGTVVNGIIAKTPKSISSRAMSAMIKINDGLTKDEFEHLQKGISNAFDKSNLASKGVSILRATKDNSAQVNKIMKGEYNKGLLKYLPERIKEYNSKLSGTTITKGKNACYVPTSKKRLLPKSKLNLAFFHEAGHALNANMSTIGKTLQKNRTALLYLALPILIISLFKTKKAEGEEPQNKLDKITTFIKNNAGKLTFALYTPTLLEEALATIKGNKLAKEFLNPNLAKKVAKTNALGYLTYIVTAACAGLGVYLANKIKDEIAFKKAVNAENKQQ